MDFVIVIYSIHKVDTEYSMLRRYAQLKLS